MRRSAKRVLILSAIAIVAMVTVLAMVYWLSPKPPLFALAQAQTAFRSAQRARAPEFAPSENYLAQDHLDHARVAIAREGSRLPFLRDYGDSRHFIELAKKEAELAEARSLLVQDSLSSESNKWMAEAQSTLENFKAQYRDLPLDASLQRKATKGEILLRESRAALQRGDYYQAACKARLAASWVDHANSESSNMLDEYMVNSSQWQRWAKETIAWSSKHKDYAILIDKMAHICYLYHQGRIKHQFHAEFGPAWIGAKSHRGDRATPEGMYRITKKKKPGQTKYYKALEINYPNEADQQRFRRAKESGRLAHDAQIGGLIQIHGHGGKGVDWTNGCVALDNKDMDRLFALVSVGTPVTIVGKI